jgi:hypothetical protein
MIQWLRESRRKAKEAAISLISLMPASLYLEVRWRAYNLRQQKEILKRQQIQRTIITSESYSFKPFDDTKAIFVHIPKCAGVSVNKAIFGNLAGGHTTLDDYLNVFEPRCIVSYFKFTVVRNPWDRLVSAFQFLKAGGFNAEDRNWSSGELGQFNDFDQFVKGWLNKENIWKWHHFRPQYHYILERRGKVQLDFIGFLENLEEDFRYIAERLGLDCRLQHVNKSEHNDYRDYYNEETMRIVADVYDTDIKLLGYNFDNSSLPAQLAKRSSGRALDLTAPGLRRGNSRHL